MDTPLLRSVEAGAQRSAPELSSRFESTDEAEEREVLQPAEVHANPDSVPSQFVPLGAVEPVEQRVAQVAESGRPGRAQLLAKKGRMIGCVGCPPNCRTSGKPRGSLGEAPTFYFLVEL